MAEAAGPLVAATKRQTITVALLAALIYELRPFLRAVQARRRKDLAFPAWEFPAGQGRGVAALSGVGESATRRVAAQLLTAGRPQVFLSVGFGGGLTAGVDPGAIIIGTSYWHYSPKTGTVREVAPPPAPQSGADLANRLAAAGLPALAGSIVTAPSILAKAQHVEAFQHLTYPVLDQETSAAAEVAASHRVAFLGVRAVTDAAGEEIPGFITQALDAHRTPGPRMALEWLARDPRRVVQLVHFWRRSTLAARNLARALEQLIPLL
jgi:nucleoside phosphorylase